MVPIGRVCTFGPFHVDHTGIKTTLPSTLHQQIKSTGTFKLILQLQNQFLLFLQLKFYLLVE
jgi:hypothetical protein